MLIDRVLEAPSRAMGPGRRMDQLTMRRNSLSAESSLNKTAPHSGLERRPLSEWTDEALMEHYAQTRRRDVFAELVRRYERELYNYLRRYLGDYQRAEDVFQATFLQVHVKCAQYEPSRPFRPWLYAIATNQAIDAQRRGGRRALVSLDRQVPAHSTDNATKLSDMLVSPEESPEVVASERESAESVRRALSELSEPMRQVIHLVYYQGLKYREAAEVLSVPVGTIKSRMHAAIARLAEIWSRHRKDSGSQSGADQPAVAPQVSASDEQKVSQPRNEQ